jgi:hypothetical protein
MPGALSSLAVLIGHPEHRQRNDEGVFFSEDHGHLSMNTVGYQLKRKGRRRHSGRTNTYRSVT